MKNPDKLVGYTTPQELYMAVISGKKGSLDAFNTLTETANGGNKEARKLVDLLDEAIAAEEISMPTE